MIGNAELVRALVAAFAERGITFVPGRRVTSLDPARRVAVLDDGKKSLILYPYSLDASAGAPVPSKGDEVTVEFAAP
jgi:hypothetical protein